MKKPDPEAFGRGPPKVFHGAVDAFFVATVLPGERSSFLAQGVVLAYPGELGSGQFLRRRDGHGHVDLESTVSLSRKCVDRCKGIAIPTYQGKKVLGDRARRFGFDLQAAVR